MMSSSNTTNYCELSSTLKRYDIIGLAKQCYISVLQPTPSGLYTMLLSTCIQYVFAFHSTC